METSITRMFNIPEDNYSGIETGDVRHERLIKELKTKIEDLEARIDRLERDW